MKDAMAIFKKNQKIYSTGAFDPLILDAVTGLREMARMAYGDELLYVEARGWVISSLFGVNDVVVILVSRGLDSKKLKHIYESYRVCEAYKDIGLMDILLRMYGKKAGAGR
ncbi:vesicle trafficking protein Sec22B [Encephalitozoon intestinalis]